MVYDVKHNGRLTGPNTESLYSGVVSLRGIRLFVFLAELNGLELWGADVEMHILKQKQRRRSTLLVVLNLVLLKDILYLLIKHCMD
jgi:hypothetical protein